MAATTQPSNELAKKLSELLSGNSVDTSSNVPVFAKVTQFNHDPVLQKHTASTHFTPLVQGHRSRAADRDHGRLDDGYYDHSPPLAAERKKT